MLWFSHLWRESIHLVDFFREHVNYLSKELWLLCSSTLVDCLPFHLLFYKLRLHIVYVSFWACFCKQPVSAEFVFHFCHHSAMKWRPFEQSEVYSCKWGRYNGSVPLYFAVLLKKCYRKVGGEESGWDWSVHGNIDRTGLTKQWHFYSFSDWKRKTVKYGRIFFYHFF